MRARNALDQLVYRFQHRWETEPQFRATLSGVLGLGAILALCSCLLIVSTFANAALAGGNSTQSTVLGRGTPNTGVGTVGAVKLFPTPTYPLPPSNAIPPESPIPDSQTPPPGPTASPTLTIPPTATPCQSGCGGGGGGGHGGGNETVTGSPSPSTYIQGHTVAFIIHTSQPNIPVNVLISFPSGFTVTNGGDPTDGTGNFVYQFTVSSSACPAGGVAKVGLLQAAYPDGLKSGYAPDIPCSPK